MTGELAALAAAFLWAVASIIYAGIGVKINSINLNLIKGVLACGLMLVVLLLGSFLGFAETNLKSLWAIPGNKLLLLTISGVIGIGIGDTAYFGCLRRIGPQKGLMLESTAPVIAALLATIMFSEYLASSAWFGIMLTTIGVILVVRFSGSPVSHSNSVTGIFFGVIAATAQAAGMVLSRMALAGGEVDPLVSSLLRLGAGLVALCLWLQTDRFIFSEKIRRQSVAEAVSLITRHHLVGKMLIAVIIGTFFAIWLQQISVKYTSAGIAQTLLATCPFFGMLIGVCQGQRQPAVVWAGLSFGMFGISLLFLC